MTPILLRLSLIALFVALGYGIAVLLLGRVQEPASAALALDAATAATILPEPVALPAFSLHDQFGRSFTNENVRDNWSFLFFGYTHCPDVCPPTLAILDQAGRIIREQGTEPQPGIIFVSVDPQRDTDQQRANYITGISPDIISVTGTDEQLLALSKPIGIAYQPETGTAPGDGYLINHSTSVLLIDPQARLRAIMTPPHDAAVMAGDYRKIVSRPE